jgi:hypothetical protein
VSGQSQGTPAPITEPVASVTYDPRTGSAVISGPATAVVKMQRTAAYFNLGAMLILAVFVLLCMWLPPYWLNQLTFQAAVPSWIVAFGLAGFTTFRLKLPGVDIGASRQVAGGVDSGIQKIIIGLLLLIAILLGLLLWHVSRAG